MNNKIVIAGGLLTAGVFACGFFCGKKFERSNDAQKLKLDGDELFEKNEAINQQLESIGKLVQKNMQNIQQNIPKKPELEELVQNMQKNNLKAEPTFTIDVILPEAGVYYADYIAYMQNAVMTTAIDRNKKVDAEHLFGHDFWARVSMIPPSPYNDMLVAVTNTDTGEKSVIALEEEVDYYGNNSGKDIPEEPADEEEEPEADEEEAEEEPEEQNDPDPDTDEDEDDEFFRR